MFSDFVAAVKDTKIEFQALAPAMLAQSIMESGREDTDLSKLHNNHLGMKWRPEMEGFATPVEYKTNSEPTGSAVFCKFESKEACVKGYWHFLTRAPYNGWRKNIDSFQEFLAFICPIWCPAGYTSEWAKAHGGLNYHDYVIEKLLPEALTLLGSTPVEPDVPSDIKATWLQFFAGVNGSQSTVCAMNADKCIDKDTTNSRATLQVFIEEHKTAGTFLVAPQGKPVPEIVKKEDPKPVEGWNAGWIPWAKSSKNGDCKPIATRFTYPKNEPEGMVVHFTAGRGTGAGSVEYLASCPYPCLVIDKKGVIWQGFPLTKGGSHSGTYHHNTYVGIEIIAAGRCTEHVVDGEKRYAAWFHRDDSEWFPASNMRYRGALANHHEAGWYERYTTEQERALEKLCRWLKVNCDSFSYDRVIGHDEACFEVGQGGRKNDPGGALSQTMPDFRKMLKD